MNTAFQLLIWLVSIGTFLLVTRLSYSFLDAMFYRKRSNKKDNNDEDATRL